MLHGAEAVFFTNFKYTGLGSFDVDVIFDVVDEDCTSISFEKRDFKEIEGYARCKMLWSSQKCLKVMITSTSVMYKFKHSPTV